MLVKVRRQGRRRCGAISPGTFAEDVRKAGLVVKKFIPMLPLLSRRWFAVLGRAASVSSSKPGRTIIIDKPQTPELANRLKICVIGK
jgi:hypothetical protein